jgi:CubicO group peptidase (beta-lactamase class C family)
MFQGQTYSLQDYLDRQRATGLLIIKDGKILAEHYQYGRHEDDHFVSHSMAKSVTALLIGAALADGKIRSLDDAAVTYVSDLKGSPYAYVTIRNLLRMSSGVKWSQYYAPGSDNYQLNWNALFQHSRGGAAAISFARESVAPQGNIFNYSGGDTFVLGLVVQGAIGTSIGKYTEKLWKQIGAEDDASWNVDWSGAGVTNCCFNARLRDYGRLGIALANDGEINGQQIVDKEFLLQPPAKFPCSAVSSPIFTTFRPRCDAAPNHSPWVTCACNIPSSHQRSCPVIFFTCFLVAPPVFAASFFT